MYIYIYIYIYTYIYIYRERDISKGFAPAAGPLGDLLVGWLLICMFVEQVDYWYGWFVEQVNCWYGSLFQILRTCFRTLEPVFWDLWLLVGGWGVARSTKGDSLGSRVGFLMIFSRFGEPVGSRFLTNFLFFLGLRLSILRVSSEVCFFSGFGSENDARICGRMCWKHNKDFGFR